MTVSIHQPHFLPWGGYVNKALHSDVFVLLGGVQFRKNYFQNRTQIRGAEDRALWLTLPVHASTSTTIDDVRIAEPRWREKVVRTIEQSYRKSPHFEECWPRLLAALEIDTDRLSEINERTFRAILEMLGTNRPKVVRDSELPSTTEDPTGRLVEYCGYLQADRYIAGRGGHNYLNPELFEARGITVVWQEFEAARFQYQQRGASFVEGLSIIDCLFNVGPDECRRLLLHAWAPQP